LILNKSPDLIIAFYLRLLAVVYFCAFASLWPQLNGLYGDHGIAPVNLFLQEAALANQNSILPGLIKSPSFLLFAPQFSTLVAVTAAGCLLSLALFFAVLEPFVLLALYLCYLSIVSVGQDFLSFQWDMLLLESGFISIFVGRSRLFSFSPKSRGLAVLALAWLTFRLMFSSGFVKLFTEPMDDSSWLRLTALTYHFETQPLPTPLAIFCQQMPLFLSKAACAATLFIEIMVPFLLFTTARLRRYAAISFCLMQVAIAASGNYGFFNLLSSALALSWLQEQDLDKFLQRPRLAPLKNWILSRSAFLENGRKETIVLEKIIVYPAMFMIVFASSTSLALTTCGRDFFYMLPAPARFAYSVCQSWGISAGYGLFASMTRERPELIIEGSADGANYKPYEFVYKIGALDRPPPVIAPHMPRLDWQLWFEALNASSGARPNRWFVSFLNGLAHNDECVLTLVQTNPCSQLPPRFLRVRIFNYELETPSVMLRTGRWWRREEKGTYLSTRSW